MTTIQSVKDLPDTGITETQIEYGNYVYTKDGKIGIALKKFEKDNAIFYGVELHCSGSDNKIVEISESELSLVPQSPIFDAYIQNLNVVNVFDANGELSQDERVIELVNDMGVEFEDEDVFCYCPFSGTHFELNSKTGRYQSIAGNEIICSSSLREGAKLAFEWAMSKNGLLDNDSDFLKHLATHYLSVGIDDYLLSRIIQNVEFHFDVKAISVSDTELTQSGNFVTEATQAVMLRSSDGMEADHTLTVEMNPSTFTILITLDGDLVSFTPYDDYTGDAFTRELQRLAIFDALKDMKAK